MHTWELNERPNITSTVSTDTPGYRARVLCIADGYPAEVDIVIDTKRQEYSQFTIRTFDPITATWHTVFRLEPEEVGHMPILGNESAALVELNAIATVLWETASAILRTARERQYIVDGETKAAERLAVDRATRDRWVAPEVARQTDIEAHGMTLPPGMSEEMANAVMEEIRDNFGSAPQRDWHDDQPYTGAMEEDQG